MPVVSLLLLITAMLATGHNPGGAAAADTLRTPITPDPAECTVAPRTTDEIVTLAAEATPAPESAADLLASPSQVVEELSGEPADPASVTGVLRLIRTYYACVNSIDVPRQLALFGDDLLRRSLVDYGPIDGAMGIDETRDLDLPEGSRTTFSVSAVTDLGDGRAAARVRAASPGGNPRNPLLPRSSLTTMVLETDGEAGDWLISDIIPIKPASFNTVVSGDSWSGVIFDPPHAEQLVRALWGSGDSADIEQYWQPKRRHVAALEAALPGFLRQVAPELATRLTAERYIRQYAGVGQDGQALILVNAFCDAGAPSVTEWIEQPIAVDDGGACYFQLVYDAVAGTFSDLRINGKA